MIVVLIVSSVFFLFGLSFLSLYLYFKKNGLVTPGRIHGIERYQSRTNKRTSTFYRPIIEYAFNGQNYLFTSSYGSSNISYKIGQRIEVYSLRKGPEFVRLKSKTHLFFPLIFLSFGISGSCFYFFNNFSITLIILYCSFLILAPCSFYQHLKSKKLLDQILDSLLKVKIEDDTSLKEKEVFLNKSDLKKYIGKNQKIAFIVTLVFSLLTSIGLNFSWSKTKPRSKEFFFDLLKDYEKFSELEVYIKDKNFLLSLILIFFSGTLIYSLAFQILRKK